MMFEWLILEAHFVQSLSLVSPDIIKSLLKQILVISDGFHIFLAPGIELFNNVIWIGCDFFLLLEHPHLVRIWLTKASVVIWKSSFNFNCASFLRHELEVNLIIFVKIILVVSFRKIEVFLFYFLLINELLNVRFFEKLL